MRGRGLLLISVGLNLLLAAVWIFSWRAGERAAAKGGANIVVTNTVVRNRLLPFARRQFFSWSEIESPNYDKYVANLRAIGCPESTIRDIIVADVDQLYARKRADAPLDDSQLEALEKERGGLLTRLLGPDWDENIVTLFLPHIPLTLDGPILGSLSDDMKTAVQKIVARMEAKIQAYEQSRHVAGLNADPAELARFEKEEQTELAAILTPAQLEEFQICFSSKAESLRREMTVFQHFNVAVSPDEFRSLFRATDGLDAIDARLKALGDSDDPASQAQRATLQQQREALLKGALTPEHYAAYVKLQDPAYRDAFDAAQASGAPPQSVDTLYKINQAVADEQARIAANSNLTDLQKQIELKKIELAQLQAQGQATGEAPPEPPPAPPPVATVTTQPHVIAPGENLATIAQTYQMKVSDIEAVNPGANFNKLTIGDTINLPVIKANPPTQ